MRYSRRALMQGVAATSLTAAIGAGADAAAIQYTYDALGRVTQVVYPDGTTTTYAYDGNGNRTTVQTRLPTPPGATFNQTIPIPVAGPINLRTLADIYGYDGARPATVIFTLASGTTVMGSSGSGNPFPNGNPGGIAIDTGTWPSTSYAISLTLQISGKVYGGGGTGSYATITGGAGGDAISCQENIAIIVNAGGEVKGGGGGGGAGGKLQDFGTFPPSTYNGAGGGGGFPNGFGATPLNVLPPFPTPPSASGQPGTLLGGGLGGTGYSSPLGPTGNGGAGGGPATAGVAGLAGGGSGPTAGGVAGFAIRKNGRTVAVTNNGTIVGTQA